MENEVIIKKCMKCGAMVKVIKDCTCDNCGIRCCDEVMAKIDVNDPDYPTEK